MTARAVFPAENLRNLTVDIIDKCNLACRLCYTESSPAREHMMPTADVLALLERVRGTVTTLTLTGGEALLHPGLEEIARYAKANFDEVSILSNAIDLADKDLAWIAELRIRLGVSIDGPELAHDLQRGRGAFQKSAATLLRARALGIPFWIQTVLGKFKDAELTYMVDLAEALGAFGVSFQRPKMTGRVSQRTTHWMTPAEYREVVRKVHALQASHPKMSILIKDALFNCEDTDLKAKTAEISGETVTGGCRAGLTYLYVKTNGDVLMCPFVPTTLGNVFEKDIYDIWQNGPELDRIRDRSAYTTCSGCQNFRVCRGCRAEALSWTGDLLGEDPNCWQKLQGKLVVDELIGADLPA